MSHGKSRPSNRALINDPHGSLAASYQSIKGLSCSSTSEHGISYLDVTLGGPRQLELQKLSGSALLGGRHALGALFPPLTVPGPAELRGTPQLRQAIVWGLETPRWMSGICIADGKG
jgi:hypothetical protein